MNRRALLANASACLAVIGLGVPAAASPIDYPPERLSDLWDTMKRTPGGPAAMRAAVEREFGSGILRFTSPYGAVVLLDTTSIDFWDGGDLSGMPSHSHAAAKVKIARGLHQKHDHWAQRYPILCT